ncbi:MAG: sigma-54 dependent transcriptional regulator [Gemmatimonadota bacterium]|nr:sigma-54 dependent transcriptional regulator [Gemmatimonadota bacterium]
MRTQPTAPRRKTDFHGMIGRSPAMMNLYQRIERFARARIPLLIHGETGTGKEMVAQAVREISGCGSRYVAVNCAAIPQSLLESELFGHRQGAFTGAIRSHAGLLVQADGGILFLDEIAELPVETQAKLLRVLETGEVRPVGGEQARRVSFRLIAATNQDLDALVARKRFRLDLLHRLGAARILLPPLRQRKQDIPLLAEEFVHRFRDAHPEGPVGFVSEALDLLCRAEWPGNVRELRNVVEAAAATSSVQVEAEQVREFIPANPSRVRLGITLAGAVPTLAEVQRLAEREAIRTALEQSGGNRDEAAGLLGISPATLYRRLAATGTSST